MEIMKTTGSQPSPRHQALNVGFVVATTFGIAAGNQAVVVTPTPSISVVVVSELGG